MERKNSGSRTNFEENDETLAAKADFKTSRTPSANQSKISSEYLHADSKPVRYGMSSSKGTEKAAADFHDEKAILDEIQQDIEADEEFESLKRAPMIPVPKIAQTILARNFVKGFKIQSMNMRDAQTGRLMWRSAKWDSGTMFTREIDEEIPSEILTCRCVSREVIFSSAEEMNNFRLEQRVYFKGTCIEQWFFTFGYVMAGSRNSWQQTIDAAPPQEMLSAHVLSGNIVFETAFYDDKEFLCKNTIRIFYV